MYELPTSPISLSSLEEKQEEEEVQEISSGPTSIEIQEAKGQPYGSK